MMNCEQYVKVPGGVHVCGRPLDQRGYCDRASDHVDPMTGDEL
jgi:hypothetical protein